MGKVVKTVKVSEEVYRELVKARGFLELSFGRRVTMDELLRLLLSKMPRATIKYEIEELGEGEEEEAEG